MPVKSISSPTIFLAILAPPNCGTSPYRKSSNGTAIISPGWHYLPNGCTTHSFFLISMHCPKDLNCRRAGTIRARRDGAVEKSPNDPRGAQSAGGGDQ